MANNTFTIVGKIGINKETDKFKPYEERDNGQGWKSKRLSFFVKNSLNYCNLEVQGGYSQKNPVVYGFTKSTEGEKGRAIQIPWDKRKDEEVIKNMAEFKKQVIVLDDETRRETIHEWDFIDNIKELLNNEELKDCLYKIVGNVVDSEYNGKFYRKFVPTRIYKVEEDAEQVSEGLLEFHFGEGCINDQFEQIGKVFLNGYTRVYDGSRKKEIGIPVENIEISFANVKEELREKVYKKYLEMFTVNGDEFKKIGLKVNYINSVETIAFDESMLDDEQKELIELGFITLEEVKKEMGGGKGNFTKTTRVTGLARGYSKGSQDTGLTIEEYLIKDEETIDLMDELLDL